MNNQPKKLKQLTKEGNKLDEAEQKPGLSIVRHDQSPLQN